jgi:hypothetical protein
MARPGGSESLTLYLKDLMDAPRRLKAFLTGGADGV